MKAMVSASSRVFRGVSTAPVTGMPMGGVLGIGHRVAFADAVLKRAGQLTAAGEGLASFGASCRAPQPDELGYTLFVQ
jgi:hypothetical protein